MAASDTAMTRFLFAILEQKCLKDIDWNEVARNPILPQPITNGHAARMRFSRFKQSLLGKESKPRNRPKDNKNRVTKSKKEIKGKKSNDDDDDEKTGKEDAESPCPQQTTARAQSPRVKYEISQQPLADMSAFMTAHAPTSAPMHATDMYSQLHSRLLTPCSDSDAVAACSTYGASPHSDMLHSDASFCPEHTNWAMNHAYPTYDASYPLDGYSQGMSGLDHQLTGQIFDNHCHEHFHDGGFHGHQPIQVHKEEPGVPEATMEPEDESQVTIKHEAWSSPY
jgi:hypothetical protein